MKREIIKTDESGSLILPTDMDGIAMTEYEIAELFGVFTPTIRAAIKAIYKSGVIREEDAKRYLRQGNGNIIEEYSLETIVALAFRIDSFGANMVREYLFRAVYANGRSTVHLLLTCSHNAGTTAPN